MNISTKSKDLKIPKAPFSLFLSVTSRCNLACQHCAVYSDRFDYEPDLATEQWLKFADEIADLKIFRVKISGGEPFVREDIFDILDSLYKKPLRISINTSGTLINEEKARRISEYLDKLDDIMVSLDGAEPGTFDALRGQGAFEKAVPGIAHLVRFVGKICAYCTVTRHNFRELRKIAKLANEIGITSIKYNELLPEGRGLKYQKELQLDPGEKTRVIEELREIRKEFPFISGTYFQIYDIFEKIRSVSPEELKNMEPGQNPLSGCGALTSECAVRPDGWATPCDRLPELRAAKILETPLDIIWRESDTFAEFRKRFTTPIASLSTCHNCEYAPLCTGGCPASAYPVYGTTLAGDPSCCYRIHKAR